MYTLDTSSSRQPRGRRGFSSAHGQSGHGPHRRARFSGSSQVGHSTRGGYGRPAAHGGRRPYSRGGNRGGASLDVSKFINKAVITETVEKFVPDHMFSDFAIDQRLKATILKKGYQTPTPIQDKIIPHVLRGADVVGIANTGTGKTAAFLIPLINKVLMNPQNEKVLVVVPTRELALQVDAELKGFAFGLGIFSTVCVGGANIQQQIKNLRYVNHFVIGTPGRLKDLIDRKVLNLAGFNTIVLDEADRMLDMGFIADMKFLMSFMPANRHTLFFSATMSSDIQGLIKNFLREPVHISVKTQDTAKTVEQDVVRTRGANKLDILSNLLRTEGFKKVIIFGRTKHGVEKLSRALVQNGFAAESIHGDKSQNHRQRSLQKFKKGDAQVLVATDVAARGLDIDGVTHVINFDIPATYEDYVHRIGRTGRAGKKGVALTFIE